MITMYIARYIQGQCNYFGIVNMTWRRQQLVPVEE
jgi:hypothetical protein